MRTVRIKTTPGRDPGQHVGLVGLSCHLPGHVRAVLHTVTYYDRTGSCRRSFGEPELPGPYAFLTPHLDGADEDLVAVEHVTPGALVDIGLDRFRLVDAAAGELLLELVAHDPFEASGATAGLQLSVARDARGDFTAGGMTRFADTLTCVGFLLPLGGMPSRLVTPMTVDARLVEPATERPPVAIEVRRVSGEPARLSVHRVEWSEGDDRWVIGKRGRHGGNFASWSDSRVGENLRLHHGPGFYGAIAVHDREPD